MAADAHVHPNYMAIFYWLFGLTVAALANDEGDQYDKAFMKPAIAANAAMQKDVMGGDMGAAATDAGKLGDAFASVAGFWAKLFVFWAAVEGCAGWCQMYWLVLVGAILTVVALFYYLLVAKRMYIDAPERTQPVVVSPFLAFSILVCVAGVVGVGAYPKPLVMAALRAASSLF